jgi:general secretion pathway protein C
MKPFSFHHNPPMPSVAQSVWWPRLAALVLSALAAGSAVFWALKWPASQPATTLQTAAQQRRVAADPALVARALGANQAAQAAARPLASANNASRLALLGVVANSRQGGIALIAVDGKPARPFRVGAKVDGDWLLQSVAPRRAVLTPVAEGQAAVTLELPQAKGQ